MGAQPNTGCCSAYFTPAAQWRNGRKCALATHLERKVQEEQKIDPLKRSKQIARGKRGKK